MHMEDGRLKHGKGPGWTETDLLTCLQQEGFRLGLCPALNPAARPCVHAQVQEFIISLRGEQSPEEEPVWIYPGP